MRWYGTHTDIDEVRRARRTLQAFSELGPALSASLEVRATLDAVMHVVVPEFADWAIINLADEDGQVPENVRGHASMLVVPLVAGGETRGTLNVARFEDGRGFSPQDVDFFEELARRIAPAIANAELFERERRVARSFQDAALPAHLPDVPAATFTAIYEAGKAEAQIGGDWYDAFALGDGRLVLSIGDVAGSGLHAAVTMANMRQAIRGVAYVHPDPVLMLEAADLALRSESPEIFVTAFVAVIDPVEDTISYTTAGHPSPLLRTASGEIVPLVAHGLPLGLREHDEAPGVSSRIEPGSVLVMFTDGLIESTHDIEEGYRRLERALGDPEVVASRDLAARLRDAVLLEGPRDDVAILCARYSGVTYERHRVDVRNAAESARFAATLVSELERSGYAPDAIVNAEVVLAELIGNLVRHTPGTATFVIDAQPGHTVLHALDEGPGYRFSRAYPATRSASAAAGLFLISALAEAFT